jgi:hypothetical protein
MGVLGMAVAVHYQEASGEMTSIAREIREKDPSI